MADKPLVLITGAARSGTSLTAGILKRHGLNFGRCNRLNENGRARAVVKQYLRDSGVDPLGQKPLPDIENLKPAPDWRNRILAALDGAEIYKCAKAVLFWPLWVEHFPDARWVIVRRDRSSLTNSLMRTGFMRAYQTPQGWGHWIEAHENRIEELKANANCVETWPRDFIADADAFFPVARHCGVKFDPRHVHAEINPALYVQVSPAAVAGPVRQA